MSEIKFPSFMLEINGRFCFLKKPWNRGAGKVKHENLVSNKLIEVKLSPQKDYEAEMCFKRYSFYNRSDKELTLHYFSFIIFDTYQLVWYQIFMEMRPLGKKSIIKSLKSKIIAYGKPFILDAVADFIKKKKLSLCHHNDINKKLGSYCTL